MGIPVNSLEGLIKKGKESFKYKPGVCVVKSCPTRPGKTDVGPCSVCKGCQFKFDHGNDPTKSINWGAFLAGKKAGREAAKKELQAKAADDSTIQAAA
jgi:hypothetical protein